MLALLSLSILECNLKGLKSKHKPSATVSKNPDVVVPTMLVVAHEPQDQGGVEGAEVGGPQAEQIPDELAGIPDEELGA